MKKRLLLELRNLITARKFNIAEANRELQCLGAWRTDHALADSTYAIEISRIIEEIKTLERKEMEGK